MAGGLTLGSFDHVRGDPRGCSRWLSAHADLWGVTVVVALHDRRMTVLDVRLEPPPPDLPNFPGEHVRVTVAADGRIFVVPVAGDARTWLHRYPRITIAEILRRPLTAPIVWEHLFGSLCLWYPDDPDHLRWHWDEGIDIYLRVVQRHLWSEEYWRRHGTWPVEDAPHGDRRDGHPHPILTPALRSA